MKLHWGKMKTERSQLEWEVEAENDLGGTDATTLSPAISPSSFVWKLRQPSNCSKMGKWKRIQCLLSYQPLLAILNVLVGFAPVAWIAKIGQSAKILYVIIELKLKRLPWSHMLLVLSCELAWIWVCGWTLSVSFLIRTSGISQPSMLGWCAVVHRELSGESCHEDPTDKPNWSKMSKMQGLQEGSFVPAYLNDGGHHISRRMAGQSWSTKAVLRGLSAGRFS